MLSIGTVLAFLVTPFMPAKTKQVTAEPFSRESLIAWLENKNPLETYHFTSTSICLWGQYTKAHGGKLKSSKGGGYDYIIGNKRLASGCLNNDWHQEVACGYPRTFGGALTRTRAIQ